MYSYWYQGQNIWIPRLVFTTIVIVITGTAENPAERKYPVVDRYRFRQSQWHYNQTLPHRFESFHSWSWAVSQSTTQTYPCCSSTLFLQIITFWSEGQIPLTSGYYLSTWCYFIWTYEGRLPSWLKFVNLLKICRSWSKSISAGKIRRIRQYKCSNIGILPGNMVKNSKNSSKLHLQLPWLLKNNNELCYPMHKHLHWIRSWRSSIRMVQHFITTLTSQRKYS